MRQSILPLLLSFTLAILPYVQGGVLRGSQSQPLSATRLFRIAKKNKNKTALSVDTNKLSSGSAAGAAGSVVKNKKKCKKKKVKVKVNTNDGNNSNTVKSSSSSSAGDTVGVGSSNGNNGGLAATVTKTTTAPKSTTTVNPVKTSTTSTNSVNSSNNNNGGSAITTATKTTAAPKTTTKTTPYPDDFFAVSSSKATTTTSGTTTKPTTTKATTKATEVVQKATEDQEQKTTTLPPIDGLVFQSKRSMDTAINVAASTDNANVVINNVVAAAAEWEWIDICNPDGTLIPPNTYSPTISPGEVDDWSGWLNVDVVADDDDDDDIDGNNEVNGETVEIDGSDETNNAVDTTTDTDVTVSSPSNAPITVNEDSTEDDGIITTNDDDDDEALSSPGCTAFQKNQVYTTSLPAVVSFLYEISVDATTTTTATATNSTNVNSILRELQQRQIEFIGSKLIQCELFIRRRRRQLQESQVDGISASPDDTILDESCTVLPPSTTNTTTCHVVQGQMTLYLRENSPYSSVEQSTTQALKLLMTEFNRENSPFVSNGSYGVDGVRAIRYITSTSDMENGGYSKGEVPTVNVGGAIEETDNMASKNSDNNEEYTSVGIALISVGAVALVSILVLVTKLGRESMKNGGGKDRTYAEFDDDENDLDKEWGGGDDNSMNDKTMGSVSSNDSPTRGLAVIEGDESIYTHGTTSTILRELIVSEAAARAHNIGPDEDSTMHQQPIFLKTDEDSYGMEVYTINKNRSIYTQDSRVERPRFENPARLRGNRREYVVDDTVEF